MAALFTKDNIASSQKQQLSQRRAPPPSLASLDSLNPFRPTSASNWSTPRRSPSTPSFLSPPILSAPLSSPPPQLEAEDYLAVQPHATQPKKRRHRRSKRVQTFLQITQDKDDASSTAKYNDGDASGSESGDNKGTASVITSLSKAPTVLDTAELFIIKGQSTKASLAPTTTHKSVRGDLTATSKVKMDAEPDSVAISSLRRMNYATKRFSVSKAHDLRRLSHAMAAPFHSSFAPDQLIGPTTSADAERIFSSGISQTDVSDFLHTVDTRPLHRKDSRSQQKRVTLETPTTITLRKASDAYFIMVGPRDEITAPRLEQTPVISRSLAGSQKLPVSLLDFRSKRVCEPRKKSMWYSLPLLSEQDLSKPPNESPNESPTSEITITPYKHSKPRKPSLTTLQPRTQPSDPALTFSSVHRTTPTCLLDPPSRRTSCSTGPNRHRTSTIQIQTRTSVHEIIWAEEAEENGTSDSSASPTRPLSRKPSVVAGNITPKIRQNSEPAPPSAWKPIAIASPKEMMAEWSWDTNRPLQPRMIDDPIFCSPIDEVPPTPAQKRPSKSKDSSVESFPPLLERNSTTEWRRAPLVDINEPLGGKGGWLSVVVPMAEEGRRNEMDEDGARGAGDEEDGGREKKRRKSTHPFAEARMGQKGRVGSSVGVSGGKRVSWTRT